MSEKNGWQTINLEPIDDAKEESYVEADGSERIPAGYRELKGITGVFVSDDEIVVTGEPDEDDESHNCDEMGCSSVSHVIFRANLKK